MMEKQLIPAGYKQTEVGLIPEDWEIDQLGNLSPFIGSGKTATNGKGEYLLFGSTGVIGTCKSPEYFGDAILVARVGANAGKLNFVTGEYGVSDNTIIVRIKSGFNVVFFKYQLIKKNLNTLVFGSGQPLITGSQLKALLLPVPTIEEQTAIANALSDVDALIAALEKLINKKSAIKTAAMQQLLTGKKRLPPFDQLNTGYKQTELGEIPGDWEVIDFGDLFQPTITRKPIKQDMVVSFVGMQDVSESAQLISPNIISYNEVKSGFTYFEKNDVLVAKITPCFENGKGCIAEKIETNIGFGSTEFHVLRANERAVAKYIYFITTTGKFRKQLESEMVGSAGHRRVPMIAIEKYRIPCSNHIEEQTAIATVLSDMDKDLEALQHRLHKTQQVKQGMMQELLTGKTRLV